MVGKDFCKSVFSLRITNWLPSYFIISRYIIQCAAEFDAVVVSGDNYRDLVNENPRWRSVIENRLLPFTWVGDMIMFPKDPLGRYGPTLEEFLRHPKVDNAGVIDIAWSFLNMFFFVFLDMCFQCKYAWVDGFFLYSYQACA